MTPDIQGLSFDQLRTLHREIGALIAEKRSEALEQLKTQIFRDVERANSYFERAGTKHMLSVI